MSKLIEILPNVYGVKVPIDANIFEIKYGEVDFLIDQFGNETNLGSSKGNWRILGFLTKDEITLVTSQLVQSTEIDVEQYDGILITTPRFWDYELESFSLSSSDESFRSALPKEIYFENPFQEANRSTHTNLECENWQTAQENITEKLLILQISTDNVKI